MINHYDNESRLTAILRCVVDQTADAAMLQQLGPARTREEIFVSRALGKKPWAAIPPRTTLEMWLAFIAEDAAEPTPGSYTVRSCAESCIITYARRVKGATAIVPIFPPHNPYEIALAKLAGILPVSYGVQGRPWELLINQIAGQGPRKNVAVIYGSSIEREGDEITYMQNVSGGPPSPTHFCPITPGLSLIRDDGSRLDVYGGALDPGSGTLTVTIAVLDMGTLYWRYYPEQTAFYSGNADPVKKYGFTNVWCESYKTRTSESGSNWNLGNYEIGGGNNSGFFYVKDPRFNSAADFTQSVTGIKTVYELDTPVIIRLTPAELQRAQGCTKYLGVGAWKLYPSALNAITAQLTTSEATTHYDLAPSEAEGWTFEISVDGQTATGAAGALSAAAGDHSITITATPAAGAAACYIHPTLYSEEAAP